MAESIEIISEQERESMITWCVLLTGYSRSYFESLDNRELTEVFKERQPKLS